MRVLVALALLLAVPAHAQERFLPGMLRLTAPVYAQTTPDLDEDGCIASAERMDARKRAKEQPPAQEKEDFEACIGKFNCKELSAAVNAGKVPTEAINTHTKGMLYTMRYCGNTSTTVKEPEPVKKEPELEKIPADSAFGQSPKSMFPR